MTLTQSLIMVMDLDSAARPGAQLDPRKLVPAVHLHLQLLPAVHLHLQLQQSLLMKARQWVAALKEEELSSGRAQREEATPGRVLARTDTARTSG